MTFPDPVLPTDTADAPPSVDQLHALIDQRFASLQALLTLTTTQEQSIEAGHMNQLMPLLAQKQRLIETFVGQSQQLGELRRRFAVAPEISAEHRARHEQCDQLHRELLQREAACEQTLARSRERLEHELTHTQGAQRAVSRYNESSTARSAGPGTSLDLSSDA